jgi:hypothetical protein
MIKNWGKFTQPGLLVAEILLLTTVCRANNVQNVQSAQNIPNCLGDAAAVHTVATIGTSGAADAKMSVASKPHSVRLSWNASVPASASPTDAIKGYNVYRRLAGKEYEKLSVEPVHGTSCIDTAVQAGQTYYYQTRAISVQGVVSKPSNETKATVPSQ